MSDRFALRVPCSTSNLGPGFDSLGLCLGLFLDIDVCVDAGAPPIAREVEWSPAATWADDEDLIVRSMQRYAEHFDVTLPSLKVSVSSEIPVGRGFGSSGAATAAGLLIAAEVDPTGPRARTELVHLALELEGHPDNGTASLLGGCTLSIPHEDGLEVLQHPIHPSLGFALAWPEAPFFTEQSRAVLPESVPFADAVENPRRLALLLDGLRTGQARRLTLGVHDRLHERFRRALIPGADKAVAAALEAGAYAACLSGAGSGIVAIGPREGMAPVAEALRAPLEGGHAREVSFEPGAPTATRA